MWEGQRVREGGEEEDYVEEKEGEEDMSAAPLVVL